MTSAGVMRIAVGLYILLFFAYLFGPLVVMSSMFRSTGPGHAPETPSSMAVAGPEKSKTNKANMKDPRVGVHLAAGASS